MWIGGGAVCPTLTAGKQEIYYFEDCYDRDN